MAWDDVIIGQSKGYKICSAVKVFEVKGDHGISHNSEAYWISDVYLGMGITIYKDTDEGKQLAAYIKNGVTADAIYNWLVDIVFAKVTPARLMSAIHDAKNAAYEKGREQAQADIRRALGLHR